MNIFLAKVTLFFQYLDEPEVRQHLVKAKNDKAAIKKIEDHYKELLNGELYGKMSLEIEIVENIE